MGELHRLFLMPLQVGQQLCRSPSTTSRSLTPGFFLICVECGFHRYRSGASLGHIVTEEALILFPQLIIVAFYLCILR